EGAVQGWLNSPGHRANLLDPVSREVGLGYYRRSSDGRGYIAQKFGMDSVYAPVIIENEALSTPTSHVNLYIHNRASQNGFAGLGPATQMMISDDPCFADGVWMPFSNETIWSLEDGQGWRTVYVKTRDPLNRTATVSDTIYLGEAVPLQELNDAHLSTTQPSVTLYRLDRSGWPLVQLSLGWIADDTYPTFGKLWGNGERVIDPDAWGGTAYRLATGAGETSAWVWDTLFFKDTPMIAYFRVKVGSNASSGEVARLTVKGGGTEYGPLRLRGADFAAPNRYQEFALPFMFHSKPDEPFLIFQFRRSGATDVFIDAVTIFSTSQPATSPLVWSVPGGNYRGQGVWVRFTDGVRFSEIMEAATTPDRLSVAPKRLRLLAQRDGSPPLPAQLNVVAICAPPGWQATQDVPWLQTEIVGSMVRVSANQSGLNNGVYIGNVVISAPHISGIAPVIVPVELIVVDRLYSVQLPLIARN
ncbi:MAG: CAP domain-containing protein, partial [Roseiflexus sp.]|nr:CAP domain-containing protein [Roseiflexus sp.]